MPADQVGVHKRFMTAWLSCLVLAVVSMSALGPVVYAQLAGGTAQQTGQAEEPTWFATLLILGLAVSSLAFGVGYAALERQRRRAQMEQRTR